MNKQKATWITLTSLLFIGAVSASVYGWKMYKNQRVVAEAKELQAKMFDENTSREDRSKLWEEMRERRDNMSDAERQAFGKQMRDAMKQRMMQQIDQYFELPENERVAYLDQEIQRQEERRREWEERRREREANGETGGRGDRGDGGGQAGRGGRGGPGGGGDPAERARRRDEFRRRIRDNTTPEERAKFQAYREAIETRREELGLPPGRWYGGGRR